MDLRSIINNEAGESANAKKAITPVTPIQTSPPQQGFRDYSHPPKASPGKHPSQDISAPHQPGGPYASPSSYQGTSYQGRPPPPPPIQAPPQNDLRSPAGSYSAQSPYRQTPTSSISGGGQYPFPQHHQTPQSPAQNHQYPPGYQRESYSQTNPAPPHLQHHNSHNQVSSAPQTPPIGMPGQPHPYLQHQRSQSSISASTPTSSQSQQPFYNQYSHPQDSPVSTTHFPPSQLPQNQRQQSQPGTPLGPPISQRQSSSGFTHPTSPYQQRALSSGPFANYQQTSPAPPPPASIPRLPSTMSGYDSQRTSISERQRRSQSERERSLSVSPKTRLPSQPPTNVAYQPHGSPYNDSAKRKMDDRENSIEQFQRSDQLEVKAQINGENRISRPAVTSSPQQPTKKRMRYTEPPIWARSVRGKGNLAAASHRPVSKANGKQPVPQFQPQLTHSPPVKPEPNGHQQIPGGGNRLRPQSYVESRDPSLLLGPWESSITGSKPQDIVAKQVADWLFHHVVSRHDLGELDSRGVQVEIEAKLGQLIDTDHQVALQLPIRTEAVLTDTNRISFKSSMTEAQHKAFNEFLNAQVTETHPSNPDVKKKRVPIAYLHRRERDKFYELLPSKFSALPAVLRQYLNQRHTHKVRVTHDQKDGRILAKIIKARVGNLDIYSPGSSLDCRISINLEWPFEGDLDDLIVGPKENELHDRMKDRLSYTQSHYQIDLTQVTQGGMKEHELEIELSAAALRDQGGKAVAREPQEYLALVEGFVDNIRVLSRFT